ncbi:transposase, IS91 family [Aliivibrio wodanis]|uniref:Transposase, IS91 family n=1 Tax=Aliivibrio wodanis TaxID=80852 RepID=A0A090IKX0_9GAMM|nr:transposase, IS91 family [Aliivibrio wodanis]
MSPTELERYHRLYELHLTNLTLQGKRPATIDAYSRVVRRISEFFDRSPDTLSTTDLKNFFAGLISTHSWSTVKLDRNGLQFFYRHTLNYQTPPSIIPIRTKAIRTCPRRLHDIECVGITRPR